MVAEVGEKAAAEGTVAGAQLNLLGGNALPEASALAEKTGVSVESILEEMAWLARSSGGKDGGDVRPPSAALLSGPAAR